MRTPRQVKRFESAVRFHEMKGTFHPDDWNDIEREFEAAKVALVKWIDKKNVKMIPCGICYDMKESKE